MENRKTTLDFNVDEFNEWKETISNEMPISYENIANIIKDLDGGGSELDDLVEQRALLRYIYSVENHIHFLIRKVQRIKDQMYKNNIISEELYEYLNEIEEEELEEDFLLSTCFENDILKITFPDLLPHRTRNDNIPYMKCLLKQLKKVKSEYGKEMNALLKDNAFMIVNHSYKNKNMIRDNDNTELKRVVDLFQLVGIIPTDSGEYLSILHTADNEMKDHSYTTIYLTNKDNYKKMIEFLPI